MARVAPFLQPCDLFLKPKRQQQLQTEAFCFYRSWGGDGRGMSRRQKQMSLLDYHLGPRGRTLSSCLVCGSAACGGCVSPPAEQKTMVWYLNITGKRPWIILMPPRVQEAPSSGSMIHVPPGTHDTSQTTHISHNRALNSCLFTLQAHTPPLYAQ